MSPPRLTPGSRLKLLIVEDSPNIVVFLEHALHTMPWLEVAGVAGTAEGALALFALHQPGLVILDLALRTGRGLEVLQEIKQRAPACLVFVFSAHDEEPFRTRCLAEGADHFFSKTRQYQELLQQLRLLNRQSANGAPASSGVNFPSPATPSH